MDPLLRCKACKLMLHRQCIELVYCKRRDSSILMELFGDGVIPTVNRLQDIFGRLGGSSPVKLPQVAVVGSQSSVKSSVLEALVGRDFLPRGSDICTRRPLLLQLVNTNGASHEGDGVEWGEFLHLPKKKFYDFDAIRKEIEAETNRGAGANKGVSDKQIRLKVFSPNVLTITLIDLPGITKVPVGDQPSDIESQIRSMIRSYIESDTCLILAVSPANSDLTNSDALQMAKLVDPDGSRTLGVITKLDIMDKGTNARDFLLGRVVPLRLGYVGVVNRCQEDIMRNRTIKDALANEERFFRTTSVYHGILDNCGIQHLAKKLNQILVQHIEKVLPGLKSELRRHLADTSKECASYYEVPDANGGEGLMLLSLLSKYSEAFWSMIEGGNDELPISLLSGGARIYYIFQSIFVKCLEESNPCDELSDEEIHIAIQNVTGPRCALFMPEDSFKILMRKQIARLLDPSIQCAKFIYHELVKMSHSCIGFDLRRFPVLVKRINDVVGSFLRNGLEPAENMIGQIIEMEMGYINTSHPNFIGGNRAMEEARQRVKDFPSAATLFDTKTSLSDSEKPASVGNSAVSSGLRWGISTIFSSRPTNKHRAKLGSFTFNLKEPPSFIKPSEIQTKEDAVEVLAKRLLLESYFDIVRRNLEDYVPKTIMHFMVNPIKRSLHNVFITELYRKELFAELLHEAEEVSLKRKRAHETKQILEEAIETLDQMQAESAPKKEKMGSCKKPRKS